MMQSNRETDLAEKRTGLAFERTSLAFERTALANSQTLLAYCRTAIAVFAAGIGMFEFVSNQTIVTIGVIMMIAAPIIAIVGVVHYFRVKKKITILIDEMEED